MGGGGEEGADEKRWASNGKKGEELIAYSGSKRLRANLNFDFT